MSDEGVNIEKPDNWKSNLSPAFNEEEIFYSLLLLGNFYVVYAIVNAIFDAHDNSADDNERFMQSCFCSFNQRFFYRFWFSFCCVLWLLIHGYNFLQQLSTTRFRKFSNVLKTFLPCCVCPCYYDFCKWLCNCVCNGKRKSYDIKHKDNIKFIKLFRNNLKLLWFQYCRMYVVGYTRHNDETQSIKSIMIQKNNNVSGCSESVNINDHESCQVEIDNNIEDLFLCSLKCCNDQSAYNQCCYLQCSRQSADQSENTCPDINIMCCYNYFPNVSLLKSIIRIILFAVKYISQLVTVPLLLLQIFDTYSFLCFLPDSHCSNTTEYNMHLYQAAITLFFYCSLVISHLASTLLIWNPWTNDSITNNHTPNVQSGSAAPPPRGAVTSPSCRDAAPSPRGATPPPRDAVTSPRGAVTSPRDAIAPPGDVVTPPELKDAVIPPGNAVTAHGDPGTSLRGLVTLPEDVVTPPEDVVTPLEDVVTSSEDADDLIKEVRNKFEKTFNDKYPWTLYLLIDLEVVYIITFGLVSVVKLISSTASIHASSDKNSMILFNVSSEYMNVNVTSINDAVLWNCRKFSDSSNYYKTFYWMVVIALTAIMAIFFSAKLTSLITVNSGCGFKHCTYMSSTFKHGLTKLWYIAIHQELIKWICNQQKMVTYEDLTCHEKLLVKDIAKGIPKDIPKDVVKSLSWVNYLRSIIPYILLLLSVAIMCLAYSSFDLHPIACIAETDREMITYKANKVELKFSASLLTYQKVGAIHVFGLSILFGVCVKLFFYLTQKVVDDIVSIMIDKKYVDHRGDDDETANSEPSITEMNSLPANETDPLL